MAFIVSGLHETLSKPKLLEMVGGRGSAEERSMGASLRWSYVFLAARLLDLKDPRAGRGPRLALWSRPLP